MRRPGAQDGPGGPVEGVPTRTAPPGRAARDELWALVEAAQAGDPLRPVTVAVPSPYAGLALRRDLGRRRGLVNVRFLALARIAELLGAPRLAAAGRVPLTAARRVEAVHAALRDAPGPFAAVATQRSTEDSLAATFDDLRRVDPEARSILRSRGRRAAAVLSVYERFLALTSGGYDEEDLALAAAAMITEREADRAALDELGHVIVHLPRRLSYGETALVQALGTVGRASMVVVGDAPAPPPPRLVQTPDPEDEARAALRRLLADAEAGTPLGRMAILYPVSDPYARLVPELLDGAGVPWNGPSPDRLADSVAGRVLLGVVDLVDADFARDAVAAWLVAGPVLDANRRRVPGARWDLVSRTAGVVGGREQWRERLARRRRELEADLARADDDGTGRPRDRVERDLEQVVALDAFVAELLELTRPPETPGWAAFSAWAGRLSARYLGGEGSRGDWTEADLDASRRIDQALADLAALDDLGAPVDPRRFREALDAALDAPTAHVGTFGAGVFVGPLHAAYAADFSVVAILGGAEGTLPPRGREDPFLTDADRAAAGLPTTATRRADQRDDYTAALAAAATAMVCFPRADPRAEQVRLPARWVLDAAAAHAGRPLSSAMLAELGGERWLDVVPSFQAGVTSDGEPGSLLERDLRALVEWRDAGHGLLDHPLAAELGPGYRLAAARRSDAFTSYDGNVGPGPTPRQGSQPIAATTLQDWAVCPFRYLIGRVLRVRDVPRPEAAETIHPLDEGTLVHAILEQFVAERPPSSPDTPWDAADVERMRAIVAARCDDAQARGLTGRQLLWRLARRRIEQSALRFLSLDATARRAAGAAPRADTLETAFGIDGTPPVTFDLGRAEPVAFRGRIDRLDLSPDGTQVIVYDYKTGRLQHAEDLELDPVGAGQLLQLPVYALAAQALTGAEDAAAYYWFTRAETVEQLLVGYPLDAPVRDRFAAVVATILDGVDRGCFPAVPGERTYNWRAQRETFEHCFHCPYDRLCPLDRGTAWARKGEDDAVAPYRALDPEPAE